MVRLTSVSKTLVHCISVAVLLSISGPAAGQDYATQAKESDAYLTNLVNARVTGGSLLVTKAGRIVHTGGYGWNSEVPRDGLASSRCAYCEDEVQICSAASATLQY